MHDFVARHEVSKRIKHWYLNKFKFLSNRSEVKGTVLHVKELSIALYVHLRNNLLKYPKYTQ